MSNLQWAACIAFVLDLVALLAWCEITHRRNRKDSR